MTVFSMHAAMAACVHYLAVNDQLPKPLAEARFFLTFGLGFGCLILLLKIFTKAEGLDKLFFPLIDHKNFEMAFVLSLKSSYNRK